MFIPLHDANSLKHIRLQYVTIGLIVVNVLVWLFTGVLASDTEANAAALGLGFIPAVVFDYAYLEPALQVVPDDLTAITYAFLHLDFWHLAGNMLFLWVFGDNVEDALGHFRFLIFYLACAIAGALFHGFVAPTSEGPLIGASGAVSGVVAAYFLLHPKVRVWVLVLMRIPLPLPAFIPPGAVDWPAVPDAGARAGRECLLGRACRRHLGGRHHGNFNAQTGRSPV